MSSRERDRTVDHEAAPLTAEERRFVDGLNASYAPRPLSPARRAALDARIRERLESRWTLAPFATGVAAVAIAAAALVWLPWSTTRVEPASEPSLVAVEAAEPDAWEQRLFLDAVLAAAEDLDEEVLPLPADYAAIDTFFFDG